MYRTQNSNQNQKDQAVVVVVDLEVEVQHPAEDPLSTLMMERMRRKRPNLNSDGYYRRLSGRLSSAAAVVVVVLHMDLNLGLVVDLDLEEA